MSNRKKGLTLRIALLVLFADIIQFIILVSFKKLSVEVPPFSFASIDFSQIFTLAKDLVFSPYFWMAAAGMISSFIIWPSVLAALDLSMAYPLGSLSYVFIPFLSILLLGEKINFLRWIGILTITIGIGLLSFKEKVQQENL